MMPRKFFQERPSLPWQQHLEHNGLELGYVRDISTIFASDGVFLRSVYFGMGSAQLFKSAHMHPRKNHTLSIRKIVII